MRILCVYCALDVFLLRVSRNFNCSSFFCSSLLLFILCFISMWVSVCPRAFLFASFWCCLAFCCYHFCILLLLLSSICWCVDDKNSYECECTYTFIELAFQQECDTLSCNALYVWMLVTHVSVNATCPFLLIHFTSYATANSTKPPPISHSLQFQYFTYTSNHICNISLFPSLLMPLPYG